MAYEETVYLSLGSNIGDREAALRGALILLKGHMVVEVCSAIYETEPWGYLPQPYFLNMVCRGTTQLPPEDLLEAVKSVERKLGRRASTFKYGSRLIDVDILFYGRRVLSSPSLSIPHARLAERAFVLVPLMELSPDLEHPILGKTVRQMRDALGPEADIRPWYPPQG